nr:MAG TPA: hypothetical protein [Caudoviricetes sp.]
MIEWDINTDCQINAVDCTLFGKVLNIVAIAKLLATIKITAEEGL